jgi:copper chaperone NosL
MRILTALAILAAAGCGREEAGPVPIAYGEDECSLCRMIISEAPFAAEARLGPGRFEKYDDIGCLAERLDGGAAPAAMWVSDHAEAVFKPLESMTLVHIEDLKTPMASGVAAFADRGAAERFLQGKRGRFVTMDDVRRRRRGQ